ncbi:MAG: hypothetical protein U0T84_07460 [Chitinophagales bacterium]
MSNILRVILHPSGEVKYYKPSQIYAHGETDGLGWIKVKEEGVMYTRFLRTPYYDFKDRYNELSLKEKGEG